MARRRVLVDLAPLRQNRSFRLLWSGYLATNLGSQLTVVAVAYQTFALTHSSLDVGLVSLVQLGPLLLGAFGGGAIADHVDRRRLLICTQALLAGTSIGLALNALSPHPALWPLFVCSAASAGLSGVDNPTRTALVVDLVGSDQLVQANALWQVLFQTAQIAGPAVGGVILAKLGVPAVYWSDAASFAVSLACLAVLPPRPFAGARRAPGLSMLLEGLRFVGARRVLQAAFLVDLNAMIFGMPRALFPALALDHFHGGTETVGLLYSAPAVGALAGALLTGWLVTIRRQGRAVLIAVAVWGLAIACFGLMPWLAGALAFLAVAGAADVVSAIFRSTIVQVEAPANLRGRVQAVQTAVVAGGPRIGDLEAGAVASLAGAVPSVVSGGLVCLAGVALLARMMPAFGRYRAPGVVAGHDSASIAVPPAALPEAKSSHAAGAVASRPAPAATDGHRAGSAGKVGLMEVGIVGGTGPAGRALALRLAASGNAVAIGSRSPERAAEVVSELVAAWPGRQLALEGCGNAAACARDVVVLATPWDAAASTVGELRDELEDRVLVSMVNALEKVGREFHALVPARGSIAATLQALVPATKVAIAFQHLPARRLAAIDLAMDADVLVCADHSAGAEVAGELVESVPGLRALQAGSLASAGPIEAMTAVLLSINIRYRTEAALRLAGVERPASSGRVSAS